MTAEKAWWRQYADLAPFALPTVFVIAVITALHFIPASSAPDKVTVLCDETVHQLLTTKDLVELQRATFIVRWFNCGIRGRLP
jgi:hypothetical protein